MQLDTRLGTDQLLGIESAAVTYSYL